jgi:hypothetical protein
MVKETKAEINVGNNLTSIFLMCLTMVFVIAKILGYVTFSWWWVFAPLWMPVAVAGILLLLFYAGRTVNLW